MTDNTKQADLAVVQRLMNDIDDYADYEYGGPQGDEARGKRAAIESAIRGLGGPAMSEPMARFCPGCGSVGVVPKKFRDCCPDGASARIIPASLAAQCHNLFQGAINNAVQTATAQAVAVPAVPEGMQLMPVDPTLEMMSALTGQSDEWLLDGFRADYRRMLAAAPTPHTEPEGSQTGEPF